MLPIALALGASALYGVSDFLGGLRSRAAPLLTVLLVSQGAALAVLLVAAAVSTPAPPAGEYVLYGAVAGIFEALGIAALYRGLAVGKMAVVAPVAATAAVVPVLFSILLGEEPTAPQAAGIAVAIAGVVAISALQSPAAPGGDARYGLLYGLAAAIGFGGFFVAMDAASEGGVLWALLVARIVALGIFLGAFLAVRGPLGVGREGLPALALIGLFVVGAEWLYAVASTEGDLGAVAVLSSLYPVVTIALARIYLRERVSRGQLLGVALVLIGVVAISA